MRNEDAIETDAATAPPPGGAGTGTDRSSPPRARVEPARRVLHGVEIVDPYAWLKAPNWEEVLQDPASLPEEIRDHLLAENAYAAEVTAHLAPLIEAIGGELRGRMDEEDREPPLPDGRYAYYSRYREGGQHPIVCRVPRDPGGEPGGPEEELLDGDALAGSSPFFSLAAWAHSPDHRLLAYAFDAQGAEFNEIRVLDLATGHVLPDRVLHAGDDLVWSPDSDALFYVALDARHRASKVQLHRIGTEAASDELVHEEPDPGWFVEVSATRSRRFVVISTGDHETSDARLIDFEGEGFEKDLHPRLVAPREAGVRYDVEHWGESLVIRTDADGARDYKLCLAPLDAAGRADWRELVPHREGVTILDLDVTARHLVRLEREDGLPRVVVRGPDGAERALAFEDEVHEIHLLPGSEYDTDELRLVHSSLARPHRTFAVDLATGERTLLKARRIPSGHDPEAYVARRMFAIAPDGERVPISLLHRRGLVPDGSHALVLYGYGAYGASVPASFSAPRLSLVDRDVVHAIAHVRGGSERGRRWREAGRLAEKPNSFRDFIAAAEALVAEGYAAPGRIVADGRSAGGMLVGAALNLRPELFAGVVAEVPFVDVLATMLDPDLPLTPPEWREWGNPIEDEAAFHAILGYSPTDNVAPRPYPAVLALGGLTDPRVTYWEPAKWVARLRAATTSGRPVLLHTDMEAGHLGAGGRFDRLEELALVAAFCLDALGLAEGDAATG